MSLTHSTFGNFLEKRPKTLSSQSSCLRHGKLKHYDRNIAGKELSISMTFFTYAKLNIKFKIVDVYHNPIESCQRYTDVATCMIPRADQPMATLILSGNRCAI